MNPELIHHLRALTRVIYVVTEEENRFITKFQEAMKKHESRIWVFNGAFGLVPISSLVRDWSTRAHNVNNDAATVHDALIQVYKDDPKENENFYIFTDPDRYLKDEHAVRRVLNIIHQLHHDTRIVKMLLFVGPRRYIPEKLQRYVEVVDDRGLSDDEMTNEVDRICKALRTEAPADAGQLFRGMTSYEAEQAITQSVVRTKKDSTNPRRVDPTFIGEYKRKQLQKTDLIQWVDTSDVTMDKVGGLHRFKEWAANTKSARSASRNSRCRGVSRCSCWSSSRTASAPVSMAAALPRLRVCRVTTAPASRATAAVPSTEPSSTTTTRPAPGSSAAAVTVARIRWASSLAGMTTATSPFSMGPILGHHAAWAGAYRGWPTGRNRRRTRRAR